MSTWPEVVHETCHVFMWFNMRPFRRHVLLLTQDSMLCRLVSGSEFPLQDSGWHGRHDYMEHTQGSGEFSVNIRYLGDDADILLTVRFRPDVLIETYPWRLAAYIGTLCGRNHCYIVNAGDLQRQMIGDPTTLFHSAIAPTPRQLPGFVDRRGISPRPREAWHQREEQNRMPRGRHLAITDSLHRAAIGMDLRNDR